MNTEQGAPRVISYNRAKPAFCGLHLRVVRCVLSMKVFVRLYVGAENSRGIVVFLRSPCCASGSQTLTYEQRGVIINIVCGLASPMNSVGHADSQQLKDSATQTRASEDKGRKKQEWTFRHSRFSMFYSRHFLLFCFFILFFICFILDLFYIVGSSGSGMCELTNQRSFHEEGFKANKS